ncbi:cupin domain-containing protein [Agitococcus lubricus]|uniref:(S)-ureidoglycine aminohydrolase cupin domain-containing protein n=1 Tax=Agitococcus lubricus TaxID=1077255 RepID=A0A2T5IYB8_9GAMM|nr:cupin domain-containing protein [Agitococcus lubricus]PTQ88986.1 hypothetical protein C8N29_1097 [Agitococcus lubricus]
MSTLYIAGQPCAEVEATVDYPRPERLLTGNPTRLTYALYQDPAMNCGIWECEIGAWQIAFSANKQEFFQIIAGVVRLHASDGTFHEIKAGDAGVIPPNFQGVFEVVEKVRKYYVIVER